MNNQQGNKKNGNTLSPNIPKNINTSPPLTNRIANTVKSGYSGSFIIGLVLLLVVVIILGGAVYWAYNYYTDMQFQTYTEVVALEEVKDASSKFSVGSGSIPSSKYSNEYSISMWVNITDYTHNYGKEKVILRRGDAKSANPEIILDANTNNLIVRLKLQAPSNNSNTGLASNSMSKFQDVPDTIINNCIPLPVGGNDTQPVVKMAPGTDNTMFHHNNVFDMVSGNEVNYPTIKYMDTQTQFGVTKLDDKDMVMLLSTLNSDLQANKNVNMNKLADDNTVHFNKNFNDEIFNSISGNELNVQTMMNTNSTPVNASIKIEKFSDSVMASSTLSSVSLEGLENEMIDSIANLLIDYCNLAKELSKQENADMTVDSINMAFDSIMTVVDNMKPSDSQMSNMALSSSSSNSMNLNSISSQPIVSLMASINDKKYKLDTLSKNPQLNNSTMKLQDVIASVNNKVAKTSCDIRLSGNDEANMSINFVKTIMEVLRKSVYTYINNLGYGIRKTYPELNKPDANGLATLEMSSDPSVGTCIVRQLPLQKWVCIIVSVYNQVVDIYIDGVLASSCVLKHFPAISTSDVDITPDGGFAGQISMVKFSNTATTVERARDIYYQGPVKSSSIFSMVPNWVYYCIVLIIVIAVIYSLFL